MSQIVLQRTSLTGRQLCRGLGLSYRSFNRWMGRWQQGLPLLRSPGPPKLGPLPLDALIDELDALVVGAKRTRGTGAFHQRWRAWVARPPLQAVVNTQRRQQLRARREKLQRLRWLHPNLAWAIDAAECSDNPREHHL